jgi:hypothetical protein
MNAIAAAGDLPVFPLRRGRVEQTRIPNKRHGDRPPVAEGYPQRIFGERHVGNKLVSHQL